MIRKPSSTAFKALAAAILFASFITVSCNSDKKTESTESTKTDTASTAPAPAPVTTDTTKIDTGAGHPVVPAN